MLVNKKHKALVLKLRNPSDVLSVITSSKLIKHNGNDFVVVKHGLDEVKVLRNMGINAPAPIEFYYDWPGRFKPFKAQREAAAFMTLNQRAFNLSDMGCVDSDTEYLSPTGWVKISEYVGGDVAQYYPLTGKAEFVTPTEFVKLPCPTMIKIKTKYGVDQLLSPEHRVLLTAGSRTEVLHADELLNRHDNFINGVNTRKQKGKIAYSKACIPASFTMDSTKQLALTDDEIRLQIAVIADGYFPYKNSTCHVRVKKTRKIERMRKLLTACNIYWKETNKDFPTAKGFSIFIFEAPQKLKHFDSSWWDISETQKVIIADEVMHWDGNIPEKSSRSCRFSSAVKESADFIQYVFSSLGYIARLTIAKRNRRNKEEIEYIVGVRRQLKRDLQLLSLNSEGTRCPTITIAPSTDGFKYCFMVPSTFLIFRRNGCVFASGNTGKTLATLWAYDYMRSIGQVKRMVVISPLSTLEQTWADEIFNHFPHLTYSVVYGDASKRVKLLNTEADIYLINHDGIKITKVLEELCAREDIDLVVVDEISQMVRNAGTDRYSALNKILNSKVKKNAWGLTGTPVPNAPTDAWAQCRIMVPHKVPPFFGKFKDTVMTKLSNFVWKAKDNAMDIVHEVMQPAIRFSRDECVDLPPCTFQMRKAELSPAQQKHFKEMINALKTEVDNGQVTAVNEAIKAQKLIQIACGVVYGKGVDGASTRLDIDAKARLEVVREVVEQSGTKVIVFVPFVSAVDKVAAYLTAAGINTAVIHGGVKSEDRHAIFKAFQKSDSPRVIVAQPATISHGLTLTAASTIVWYAPITSADTFEQANARITRPGQLHNQLIVMVEGSDIERKYYTRLKNKQKLQGVLLDLVKESRNIT